MNSFARPGALIIAPCCRNGPDLLLQQRPDGFHHASGTRGIWEEGGFTNSRPRGGPQWFLKWVADVSLASDACGRNCVGSWWLK
ncbi:hypothetical protein CEXT_56541 [Caerostris extrusa]|uniref:Uncharacterized protein n=1 Tax=Caerostris extrusa TaxID=172846 RepID=A0AAV4UXT2_CAEEX|nr:hypothetical protein CEXT_56541 [Caerostris extrusa]